MEEAIERYLTQCAVESQTVEDGIVAEPAAGYGVLSKEYHTLDSSAYNEKLALVPDELAAFVRTSQPKQWKLLVGRCGGDEEAAKMRLAQRVSKEIDQHGTIAVLRMKDVDASEGAHVVLMYNRPVCNKTPEHTALYGLNRLSVMRQVRYSEKDKGQPKRLAIDMVIFLNGLPIITIELKNELTGQYHHNAIKQYMQDRQVKGEKLLEFKRCLVHFAVGTEQVYMTTKLDGKDTCFLPYNKTYANIGVESDGYRTDYLWKDVLRRDSIIDLVSYYVNVHVETKRVYNKKTGLLEDKTSTKLIFPRWHQRRAVMRLVDDVRKNGAGHCYLVQHSAGSGKSHTITWLAFRLSGLYRHFTDENKLFDSVIVVNDRVALDRQMQRNFRQFEQTSGEVV